VDADTGADHDLPILATAIVEKTISPVRGSMIKSPVVRNTRSGVTIIAICE
jgi:hypothetical protein